MICTRFNFLSAILFKSKVGFINDLGLIYIKRHASSIIDASLVLFTPSIMHQYLASHLNMTQDRVTDPF